MSDEPFDFDLVELESDETLFNEPLKEQVDALLSIPLSIVDYRLLFVNSPPRSERTKFSQLGRWIRGALGYGLRDASCTGICGYEVAEESEKLCEQPSCAYARGFLALGTREGSPAPYRISPSVFDQPEDGGRWFRLTLFGALSEDHLYWLWGVQRATRKGIGTLGVALLDTAIDGLSSQELWQISRMTFPVLPQVKSLSDLIQVNDPHARSGRLTVTFTTPLETKSNFTSQEEQLDRQYTPSLYDLILLIVRRLEALCETYLFPIDQIVDYKPITRSSIKFLTEGSQIYRSACKIEKGKRGVMTVTGPVTYKLSSDHDRLLIILKLIRVGEYIGIGRGVVEGRGSFSAT